MNSKFIACVGNYVQIIRLQCCQGTIQLCRACLALGEGVVGIALWVYSWGLGCGYSLGRGCGLA